LARSLAAGTGESAEVTISSVIRVDLSILAAAEEDYRRALYALEAQLDRLDSELSVHSARANYQSARATNLRMWRGR